MSDATYDIPFRRVTRGAFVGGLVLTALVHGAIIALVFFFHVQREDPAENTRDLMVTKMVTLGKPREKFWLPRIVVPKPKAPEVVIKVADNPDAAPAIREAPKPEDKDVSKDLKRALERARALAQASAPDEPAEGSLTGSTAGTSSEASAGDEYATQVFEAIRRNWVVPTGLAELGGLVAEIRVSIGEDGTLGNPRVNKTSGNDLFDDACVQAVKTTGKVPPPPAAVQARFRRGSILEFDAKELAR